MDRLRRHTVDERNIFGGGGIIIGMIEPFIGLLMPSLTDMHECGGRVIRGPGFGFEPFGMLEGGRVGDMCGSFAGSQRRCGLLDPSTHGRLHGDGIMGDVEAKVNAVTISLA